jgi:DNA transformation protein
VSGASKHDHEHIAELFAAFGPVTVRRMFGGAGLFAKGVMIAILDEGVIYLKADAQTIPAFEREGLKPFTYSTKDGARSLTSYWRMPEWLYDEPDELARWAAEALQAARRGTALRPRMTQSRSAAAKRSQRRKPKR